MIHKVYCCSRLLDKRSKGSGTVVRRLEANNGILMGNHNVPLVTNSNKFPNGLKTLPEYILLKNKTVLKLKRKPNIVIPTGPLNKFGLRVLVEPFQSEQELQNGETLPPMETMKSRLKEILPLSSYVFESE